MSGVGRLTGIGLVTVVVAIFMGACGVAAQTVPGSPFLFINQERLLTGSITGQALLAEEEKQRNALRSEARSLDSAFETEERQLTDQRPTTKPEDFRKLADAFDARVVKARKEQDDKASSLAQEFDQRRRQFYARVAPLLVDLMDRAGARAVFDENSALLTDQTLNITDQVIAAIDAQGDAGGPAPAPEQAAPGPEAPALQETAPEQTMPEQTMPEQTMPEQTLPEQTTRALPPLEAMRPAPRPEGGN